MPITQVASISVPEPRALSVSVWDKSDGQRRRQGDPRRQSRPVSPTVEGTVLRIRIPELNEQRRKEMVKVAHKYAEDARVAVRHVRRDGFDVLKKLLKEHAISEDDGKRHEGRRAEGDRRGHPARSTCCSRPRKRKSCRFSRRCLARAPMSTPPNENPPTPPIRAGRAMSPSSWTATAAGRRRAACRAIEGHRRGVEAVRRAVRAASEIGVSYLTIYSFSTENWSRPAERGLAD